MSSATSTAYDAETRVPGYIAGTVAPLIIGTIFFFARCYSRGVITGGWGVDDTWFVIAWFFGVVLSACNLTLLRWGTARHQKLMNQEDGLASLKMLFALRILYQFAIFALKMCFCTLYSRIFQDRGSRMMISGMTGFIILYTTAVVIYSICECTPPSDAWSLSDDKHCIKDADALNVLITGACNLFSDILLFGFVVYKIVPLKMAIRQKVALLAVISTSILSIIAAVLRMVLSRQLRHDSDLSWDLASISTWSAVEIETGIFCAAAPVLKPLIRKVLPSLLLKTGYSQSYKSEQTATSGISSGKSRGERMQDDFGLESHSGGAELTNTFSGGDGLGQGLKDTESMMNREKPANGSIRKTISVRKTVSVVIPDIHQEAKGGCGEMCNASKHG